VLVPSELVGVGIYSVPEAARLIQAPPDSVRRWMNGYTRRSPEGRRVSLPPILKGDHERYEETTALSFLDLIEARIVRAFRNKGVSWHEVKKVHEQAAKELGHPHPFSTMGFVTNGHTIIRDLERLGKAPGLDHALTKQRYFDAMIRPTLIGLEYEHETAMRWWPLGDDRKGVVLDPARSFGRPIVDLEGIPTDILVAAVQANGVSEVLRWFEVSEESVEAAVEFERTLAA
jgi:uncharacterized protein (DUF433 family)